MPSRRDQIRMSDEELERFLAQERRVTCATVGPNGRPHLMPLWYVPEGRNMLAWTFAKSQKTRNLERAPHATLQIEAGGEYGELRGTMLECDVELERDHERVARLGLELMRRYSAGASAETSRPASALRRRQRVGMRFTPTRLVSWDHRKLGDTY